MIKLTQSLNCWGTEQFSGTLKQELENLDKGSIPLHLATTQGGLVDDSNISALINHCTENEKFLIIKIGIFFNEIIAGCNCNDEPVSDNTYCEFLVSIDKNTAETSFSL
ncbi:MAG: glucosamine--fructose-6-phosphate aminotransferase [gamma proteobacterium symbiont of Taylorina sp.]|nr:glucosamine--fructose-6-phosphate aminotransferase [gamma proteobacterium symbiont of Taylorina sp.]